MIVWDVAQGSIAVEVLADHPLDAALEFHRLFERVLDDPFAVLLDSAASASRFSRRSVIAIEPEAVLVARGSPLLAAGQAQIELHTWDDDRSDPREVRRYQGAPFAELERMLGERRWPAELRAQLPEGFVGGAIGFAGYDAGRFLERLPERAARDLDLPELCFLFVDSLLMYEHDSRVLRYVVSARAGDRAEAQRRCALRMTRLRERFADVASRQPVARTSAGRESPAFCDAGDRTTFEATSTSAAPIAALGDSEEAVARDAASTGGDTGSIASKRDAAERSTRNAQARLDAEQTAPADRQIGALHAPIDHAAYAEMVLGAKAQIMAGNVFEVCVSQRLEAAFPRDRSAAWRLYLALRTRSPAPFACCVLTPFACLLSSSPERFLGLSTDGWAESRPIKGTRPRGDSAEADARLRNELATSEKDRAENVMIVDLARNDLGRVCAVDSVHVPELMIIEEHPSVFQMVSTIRGRVEPSVGPVQLFAACFPPGSMTGAPKIEAMKVIDALEPVRRGIYAGAVGYFDVGGALDFSVVIRSFVISDGRCTLNVGGAVVADSNPDAEYLESMDKARALLDALADERGRA